MSTRLRSLNGVWWGLHLPLQGALYDTGALSALTRTPMNVLIQKGDDVSLECSTDAYATINTISWSYDSAFVTTIPCSATDVARFQVSQPVPLNDCFLTALGTSATGNYGPYGCSDGSGLTAEAVAILIGMMKQPVVWICRKIRGSRGRGQSGQAIRLLQITSYLNDFQTLDNRARMCHFGVIKWKIEIWPLFTPPNPKNLALNRQFPAKMMKHETPSISESTKPIFSISTFLYLLSVWVNVCVPAAEYISSKVKLSEQENELE